MRPPAFAGRTPESGGVVLANGDDGPAQIHVTPLDNEVNQVRSPEHPATPGRGEFWWRHGPHLSCSRGCRTIPGRSRVRPHPLLQPLHPQLACALAYGLRKRALRAHDQRYDHLLFVQILGDARDNQQTARRGGSARDRPSPKGADVEGASSRASDVLERRSG